jgi:hypothetical protein
VATGAALCEGALAQRPVQVWRRHECDTRCKVEGKVRRDGCTRGVRHGAEGVRQQRRHGCGTVFMRCSLCARQQPSMASARRRRQGPSLGRGDVPRRACSGGTGMERPWRPTPACVRECAGLGEPPVARYHVTCARCPAACAFVPRKQRCEGWVGCVHHGMTQGRGFMACSPEGSMPGVHVVQVT